MRTVKFFATQIERKKLIIPGFYHDWAAPTFNILRVLIYAFTIAFIYPYLPNSESDIFKGISVLVGVLFSLGSSSIISNLIAGIVMTYMRPFQVGDRIKINDITGFVVERGPMNTRIRTHKNEYVSFPNQMILNTCVVNYNSSIKSDFDGYIVHASITMGYDVPWRVVHDILINAALKTEFTEKSPPPFVNQTKLDDFYCWYEINVYTKNVNRLPGIYSDLYKHIQDGFAESNISMYAPHFHDVKTSS
jgi:small-conductance mechanosensitive channel